MEVSRILVESGKGAFERCGLVSGGASWCYCHKSTNELLLLGSEAMEGAIKLARQVSKHYGTQWTKL